MTAARCVFVCVFVSGSVVRSFVNVLAAFIALCDVCIDSPLVCGNC